MFTVQTITFNKPKSNLFFGLDGFVEGNVNRQLAIGGWRLGGRRQEPEESNQHFFSTEYHFRAIFPLFLEGF